MSDPVQNATEAEPLKGVEEGPGNVQSNSKGQGCAGKLGVAGLSGWRTAAFLLSLFICLTIVFAFSFVLPCPVRPQYLITWNHTIPDAATYDFLAVEDTSKDKVNDVIFIYKSSEGSRNITCRSQGLPSPCLFLLAVDGTGGETLWERPLAAEYDWAQCGLEGLSEKATGCLVAHTDNVTAIDTHTGVILWQLPRSRVANGKLPVLSLPDLDGDGAKDLALVSHNPTQTVVVFLSGKTGAVIGSEVVVDSGSSLAHLLHITAGGASYLLVQQESGLYAVGVWRLAAQAKPGLENKLKKDKILEKRAMDVSGHIAVYEASLSHVLEVKGGPAGSAPSFLLLNDSSVTLLLGESLTSSWSSSIQSLLSEPSFGHYNKDKIPDIVIEEDIGNGTKRVCILDGHTGSVLWEVTLLFGLGDPQPSSVLTTNYYSVFMLWGERHTHSNHTGWVAEERSSFLLHPHHSTLLLERRNPVQHVMSFKATLLERGRHASYLILSGRDGTLPQGAGPGEQVVLTKRKIKADVSESSVLRVGGAEDEPVSKDNEDYIKEVFHRLRFSDEALA